MLDDDDDDDDVLCDLYRLVKMPVKVLQCVTVCGCAGSPEEWMPENVGALLYLCGDDITSKVLMSKAINGRVLELAGIIVSLCVVCARQAEPTSWAVGVMWRVLAAMDNGRDRLALIHAVVDAFRDNVTDLHEYFADDPSWSLSFSFTRVLCISLTVCAMSCVPT